MLVGLAVRAQRCELMDPLPCCLVVMFLYGNPGHCFSGSATKIIAGGIFGVLALLGSTKKKFCPSIPHRSFLARRSERAIAFASSSRFTLLGGKKATLRGANRGA